MPLADNSADVIVVGAGPAGSTAATLLARAGVDVLLLEKSTFPRDKVCGDGLTPRGVKQLWRSVSTCPVTTGSRNRGLRVVGGGVTLELDWPELPSFPDFGVVRPRRDFDAHARRPGHQRRRPDGTGDHGDRPAARRAHRAGHAASPRRPPTGPAEFSRAAGHRRRRGLRPDRDRHGPQKNDKRPMGVAVRRYYRSEARTNDDYLESHLELWDRTDAGNPILMPGYGWIFGLGDGTVNVGLGVLNTSKAFGRTDYRALLKTWMAGVPADWQLNEDTADGPILGAALPMGFNRTPQYKDGLLLIGDSAGLVNPFNGEGIAYAMESATLAAESSLQALGRGEGPAGRRRSPRIRSPSAPTSAATTGWATLLEADRPAEDHGHRHQARPAPQAADVPGAQVARRPLRHPRRRLGRPRGAALTKAVPSAADCRGTARQS